MCTRATLERAGYLEARPPHSDKSCISSLTHRSIFSIIVIITGVGLLIGYYTSGPGTSKWLLNVGGAAVGGPIGWFIGNLIFPPNPSMPMQKPMRPVSSPRTYSPGEPSPAHPPAW